jgi:hypothetical protein
MSATTSCPSCEMKVKVPEHLVGSGKALRCPRCKGRIPIPAAEPASAEPAAAKPATAQPAAAKPAASGADEAPAVKTDNAKKVVAAAATQGGAKDKTPSRDEPAPVQSTLLSEETWVLRRNERFFFIFTRFRARHDFFRPETQECIGYAIEKPPIMTTLLKGFEMFQSWLKTKHVVYDDRRPLFSVHVAGAQFHKKVRVLDPQGDLLWHKDFTGTKQIKSFTLSGPDDDVVAMFGGGNLVSPTNEPWGRIAGEDALQLQKDLKEGKRLRVEFMPKKPGLYLGVNPAVKDRRDVKVQLLSVGVVLNVARIPYLL